MITATMKVLRVSKPHRFIIYRLVASNCPDCGYENRKITENMFRADYCYFRCSNCGRGYSAMLDEVVEEERRKESEKKIKRAGTQTELFG